jgi:hypothetical protein
LLIKVQKLLLRGELALVNFSGPKIILRGELALVNSRLEAWVGLLSSAEVFVRGFGE